MSEVIQLSDEWFALRAGKFTASKFKDLMEKETTAAHQNVVWGAAVERMTGLKMDSYCSPAMQRGIDLEPQARRAYEDFIMAPVTEVGIVIHPELDYVSCSPDGLIPGGMVEIKCMNVVNHGKALFSGQHAKDYKWQLQGQMMCCQKNWVDIVGFHPEYPPELRLAITRVERDEKMISELEARCISANEEVEKIVEQLKEKMK